MVSRVDFVRRLCSLHSRTVNCSVGSRSPVVLDFSSPASCMRSARRYNFFGSLVFLATGLRPGRSRNWSALRSVFPGAFSPPLPYRLEFSALPQGLVQLGFCPAVLSRGSSRCQQLLFWLRSAILPFTPLPGSVAVTGPASRARSDPRVSASPFAQRRSSQVRFSLKAFCHAMSVGSGCFGSCARFLVHVVVVSWSA
jgi:hypothetical protein